jgi:two-component system phosphate regulon sensor histidine kinase PhoR
MERNKQAFDMQPVKAGEIARASAEAVRAKFEKKNCEFSVTVAEPGASITADKDAMVTVLVNLLDNAYKYTGDEKRIALRVFGRDGQVCFAVKDNGIGMTKRQVKRVFDRFFQADSSLARRVEGCGLGLAIVKFIVDAHKGAIDVESKVGEGSEFTVKIPVYQEQ